MLNNFSDNKNRDLLLDHLLLLDKIINRSNKSLLTKLNNNNIKQLILIEKYLVKISLLFIFG